MSNAKYFTSMHALPKRSCILLLSLLLSQMALAQTEPRLGVNTTTPQHTLDVNGAINIAPDSAYQINGTPVLQTQVVNGFTNLFLGPEAGQSNTTGNRNHFSGYQAGASNTTGQENYFSGFQAGLNNTTGFANHFGGYLAGFSNTTGEFNHFSGFLAGGVNTTGSRNLAIGYQAGPTVGDLTNAGAIGYRAQVSKSNALVLGGTGQFAVQVGIGTSSPEYTLDVQGTTGLNGDVTIEGKLTPRSIDLPADSAYQINGTPVLRTQQVTNRFGTFTNFYLGPEAGQNNTTGRENYFSGYQAGQNNTTGRSNHFSGNIAGRANTTGQENHFVGFRAGAANTTGGYNHFSGYRAGQSNTTGNSNYFSGFLAGGVNTTGSDNVYIGFQAGSGNRTNAIAIGANVNARGNNTVTIGNSRHTSIGGYQPWSNLSDGRFKREVAEDVPGLDFVTRLRPVSYRVDRAALQAFLKGEELENGKTAQEQPRETGFIAQEVEELADALGYDFNGIIQPQSENDHYQLSYATFVVPLVQAVQEQQELIEQQQTQIEALQAENARLTQQNTSQQAQLDQLGSLQQRLQALENVVNLPTEASASNQ